MARSETPTVNTSVISNFSNRSLVVNLNANSYVSKSKSHENNQQNAASSSATTRRNDHHGEDLPLSSETISTDLLLLDSALKNHTDHMNAQINLARDKFKELQNSVSSERDIEQLRKAIKKLKLQIPTKVNILSNTTKDDHHGGAALSPSSRLMHTDLLLVDSTFVETKEYMDHMSVKIDQAHEKFKELQMLRSSPERELNVTPRKKRDFDELRKDIKKLKVHIPSHAKISSADLNPHRNRWPNINEGKDGMTSSFYKEPQVTCNSDFDDLSEAFKDLSGSLRRCLLCFFKFPPAVTIKKTTMIYLWIALEYTPFQPGWVTHDDDYYSKFFDEIVEKGFIQPIYQNCSLAPGSCRMNLSVRSALSKLAPAFGFTSDVNLDLDLKASAGGIPMLGLPAGGIFPKSPCWINVGEAIVDWELETFEEVGYVRILYLGRWQSSSTYHIELAHPNILHGLKNMKMLIFLSLRGISMITELPTSILGLKHLEILDLRACHNLEAIPENIGLLKSLTHLDMSECYFLEHMPKSLAQLSNLKVLKGFLIGDFEKDKPSCTLSDLSGLSKLRKLNIYVSVKDFHRLWDFDDLQYFPVLQKLTISWGGCSLRGESHKKTQGEASLELHRRLPLTLPPQLQKLDLQCFPTQRIIDWLRPVETKKLKKLYIRGGRLCDLGQSLKHQEDNWNVEILHLKYLSDLQIDWSELRILFPKVIYLHLLECPKFTNFPSDERSVWVNKEAVDTNVQLQKYLRTCGKISASSGRRSCR